MRVRFLSVILCIVLLLCACGAAKTPQGTSAPATTAPQEEGIKNIILIIGDGTGDAQIQAGELANGAPFVFRDWVHIHANTDSLTTAEKPDVPTDSAAAGTALATGVLTTNYRVALGADSTEPLKTILDYAKEDYGKATGVVSTDAMYGATPAAFSGHAVMRTEYETILHSQLYSGIDLLCSDFTEEAAAMRSLISSAGYTYCDFFSNIKSTMAEEMVYWQFDMSGKNPSNKLEKVVPYALDYLAQDPDGFVLIIEQAHVDKFCHSNDIDGAQLCANSLNNTVQAVLDWCGDRDDTAILITADHETGGLSVSTQEEFDNRYAASSGNAFYYQWTTEEHTKTPVSVYAYGFDPDFAAYYLDGNEALIKNTAVFQIMLELLKK